MGVECSKEIFEILLSVVPGETGNDEVMAFAYEHQGSTEFGFLDPKAPKLPDINTTVLKCWPAVENWLSDIETSAYLELDRMGPWFDYDESAAPSPLEIFESPLVSAVVTQKIEQVTEVWRL